jgi:hypothetical protein
VEKCYSLELAEGEALPGDVTFIGGTPMLPESMKLPSCALCGRTLTFFFQLSYPPDHLWRGFSMGVYACMDCADPKYMLPALPGGPLHRANLPPGFLIDYQTNFRFIIFETAAGVRRTEYVPRVRFVRMVVKPGRRANMNSTKLGGKPNWLAGDESPGRYGDLEMFFLLQMKQGISFPILPGAPRQMFPGKGGKPKPGGNDFYTLFLAHNIYLFGTATRDNPQVYVVTQI